MEVGSPAPSNLDIRNRCEQIVHQAWERGAINNAADLGLKPIKRLLLSHPTHTWTTAGGAARKPPNSSGSRHQIPVNHAHLPFTLSRHPTSLSTTQRQNHVLGMRAKTSVHSAKASRQTPQGKHLKANISRQTPQGKDITAQCKDTAVHLHLWTSATQEFVDYIKEEMEGEQVVGYNTSSAMIAFGHWDAFFATLIARYDLDGSTENADSSKASATL
ncbi:hypothetical protein K440DRAFT_638937 [Wilcoxina mikolae CBS 423.85]|nr:hypothetical protein K440DRAFT_638937 [Wilcoxina mikolae CBS 423.85]